MRTKTDWQAYIIFILFYTIVGSVLTLLATQAKASNWVRTVPDWEQLDFQGADAESSAPVECMVELGIDDDTGFLTTVTSLTSERGVITLTAKSSKLVETTEEGDYIIPVAPMLGMPEVVSEGTMHYYHGLALNCLQDQSGLFVGKNINKSYIYLDKTTTINGVEYFKLRINPNTEQFILYKREE